MNVLITGGAGFIGSHIVDILVNNKFKVRVLDNLISGDINNLPNNIEFIKGDIRDKKIVSLALQDIDYVVHYAALINVAKSMIDINEYHDVNINGTFNMLLESKNNNIKKFIFASSSSVYGDNNNIEQSENDILSPLSMYAITKMIGEKYCKFFNEAFNLETISLRQFNVYGPRQNPNGDYAAVIPKFIEKVKSNISPYIYGDGNQSRDFIFVEDIANFILKILLDKKIKLNGDVFNIASGKAIKINEVLENIKKNYNSNISPIYMDKREGDILSSKANINKIKQEFNWEPSIDLNNGLIKIIKK